MIGDPCVDTIRRRESMGVRIAELRHQAGLTQAGLSRLSGLTPSAIDDLEHGLVHITSQVLVSLCRAMKVDVIAVFYPDANCACVTDRYADHEPPTGGLH